MKSLLLGLHKDLHALREKLEHQCTVLSRQFTAVERLTNPCMTFSNGSLKFLSPPHGNRLKAAEDAVIAYLNHRSADQKDVTVENRPLIPIDPKLPLLIDLILQTCSQYLDQKPEQTFNWRDSALASIMEDTLGPVIDCDSNEPAWLQVSDSELGSLGASIAALQAFEHPLIQSGTGNEGFLASFLRDMALKQGGFKSFRSRLVLNKDEWRDLTKCLSAEVAKTVLGLYELVEKALEAALALDLPLQEKMRLVRLATDAISLSLHLTRDKT